MAGIGERPCSATTFAASMSWEAFTAGMLCAMLVDDRPERKIYAGRGGHPIREVMGRRDPATDAGGARRPHGAAGARRPGMAAAPGARRSGGMADRGLPATVRRPHRASPTGGRSARSARRVRGDRSRASRPRSGAHTGRPEPVALAPVAAAPEALVVSGGMADRGPPGHGQARRTAGRRADGGVFYRPDPQPGGVGIHRRPRHTKQLAASGDCQRVGRLNHRSRTGLDRARWIKNPSPSSADRSWRGAAGSPARNAQHRPHRRRTHARHPPPASSSSPGSDSVQGFLRPRSARSCATSPPISRLCRRRR